MRTTATVALTGLALFASGCAGDSAAQSGRSTSAGPTAAGPTAAGPTAAGPTAGASRTLVLRIATTGGFAGLGGPGTPPDLSLYGDGRAIGGRAPLTDYRLTRQAYRRLVSAAFAAGLATPRTVDDPRIADALYKEITFVVGGRPRHSKIIQGGKGDDRATAFLAKADPARWPRTDLTTAPRAYRPARLAVLAAPGQGTGRRWPFKPLASNSQVGTRACTILIGGDVAKAQRLVAPGSQWLDHGKFYRVTLRPLLPDEPNCAALTR